MSNQVERFKHSKRLLRKKAAVKKQTKIAKAHNFPIEKQHRFVKTHSMTCGDSNCSMCGNPRKFFKERTRQEKSFDQTRKWSE